MQEGCPTLRACRAVPRCNRGRDIALSGAVARGVGCRYVSLASAATLDSSVGMFEDAAKSGEIVVLATEGTAAEAALTMAVIFKADDTACTKSYRAATLRLPHHRGGCQWIRRSRERNDRRAERSPEPVWRGHSP